MQFPRSIIPIAYIAALLSLTSPLREGESGYVTNFVDHSVSVINTDTNTVIDTIAMPGTVPTIAAMTPDAVAFVYITQQGSDEIAIIDTTTNTVLGTTITVGIGPHGISITPDGLEAYVCSDLSG